MIYSSNVSDNKPILGGHISSLQQSLEVDFSKLEGKALLNKLEENRSSLPQEVYWQTRGIIFEKQKEAGEAIYSFEKARLAAPLNYKIYQKLESSRKNFNIDIELDNIQDVYHFWQSSLTPGLSLLIVVLIYVLLFLILRISKNIKVWLLTAFICSLLPLSSLIYRSYYSVGVLSKENLFREGPSKIFPEVLKADPGLKVVFVRQDEWFQILYPKKFEGWTDDLSYLYLEGKGEVKNE